VRIMKQIKRIDKTPENAAGLYSNSTMLERKGGWKKSMEICERWRTRGEKVFLMKYNFIFACGT